MVSSITALILHPLPRSSRTIFIVPWDTEMLIVTRRASGARHFRPAPGLNPPLLISYPPSLPYGVLPAWSLTSPGGPLSPSPGG